MADSRTKLISEQEVKDFTNISNNVDIRVFGHNILDAQNIYIKSAIGECFDDLITQTANSTLTAANTTLLDGNGTDYDGIKVALAWWVVYMSYPDFHSRITPTGVQVKSGEEFTSVDSSMLQQRMNLAKNKAEYYTDQVICFIKDNISDYPCYNDSDCCTTKVRNGYGTSGIVLDEPVDDNDIILTKDDLI